MITYTKTHTHILICLCVWSKIKLLYDHIHKFILNTQKYIYNVFYISIYISIYIMYSKAMFRIIKTFTVFNASTQWHATSTHKYSFVWVKIQKSVFRFSYLQVVHLFSLSSSFIWFSFSLMYQILRKNFERFLKKIFLTATKNRNGMFNTHSRYYQKILFFSAHSQHLKIYKHV